MITRKLLAALVGVSLVAGTLGTASAQTPALAQTQSASPADTVAPANAAKSDTTKKASIRKHHARMTSKIHRKHVSLGATKQSRQKVAAKRFSTKHLVSKQVGGKVATKLTGKRVRISHSFKRGTTKHV